MRTKSQASSHMLKEKVNFEIVLSTELNHMYPNNEDVSREINLSDSKESVYGAAARVWANELSTPVQNQYRSSGRNVNHVQYHGYFCTDGSSQMWQQYSSTHEKNQQSQTVFEKPDLYCVDQGSSMSQSTESTRNEYFDPESILLTPKRSKTRNIELKSTLNCLGSSTPENSISTHDQNFTFSTPLKDVVDFKFQFDEDKLSLSHLPVLQEGHLLEDNLQFNHNGRPNLNYLGSHQDFISESVNKMDYYDLYPGC